MREVKIDGGTKVKQSKVSDSLFVSLSKKRKKNKKDRMWTDSEDLDQSNPRESSWIIYFLYNAEIFQFN